MVSVIITTHNRLHLLKRAVQSVLSQSYIDIEIIVVADGCSDGTADYLKEIAEKSTKFHFISNSPAKGSNAARNIGIALSKGEYIAFLDDDDEWLPTKIEKQVAVLEGKKDMGIVTCGENTIYVTKDEKKYVSHILRRQNGDLSKKILFGNYVGVTSAVMVRRDLLKYELWDENMPALQDWDLWIRLCQITKVYNVEEYLFNYYNYEKQCSQITDNNDIYLKCKEIVHDKYNHLYLKLNSQETKELEFEKLCGYSKRCFRNGKGRKARQAILKAFIIKPERALLKLYIKTFFPYKWSLTEMTE